jgi:branched-subunit amino acid transport protein
MAVLAAMLFPAIATQSSRLHISPQNLFLVAAFPTLLVAWKTRSLFTSVITGVIAVALARRLLPL